MALAEKVLTGDVQAAARLISRIEDEFPDALAEMDSLYPHTGEGYIVGVTGAPGVGKSTLTDNLIGYFRKQNKTVGVIAISTIHVMDALGRDIILVETVGSGQIEIDIVKAADTTLVVLTPGAGDEIQTMKAGILEAADILVVNKADKEGADRLKADLESMLELKAPRPEEWQSPVILTEAIHDKGTEELAGAILGHREFLVNSGGMPGRLRERARLELLEAVEGFVSDFIYRLDGGDYLEKLVDDFLQGRTNPQRAAREITGRLADALDK